MSKRLVVFVCLLLAVLLPAVPEAQQPRKIPVIGYLTTGYGRPRGPSAAPLTDSFRQGLRELGYIEGKNILIEYRYAEGKSDRLLELATELVSLKVDVIVATVTPAALAAKKATRTIPIVFTGAADRGS